MEKEDEWNLTSVFKRSKGEAETSKRANLTAETVWNWEQTTKSGIWRNTTGTRGKTKTTEIWTCRTIITVFRRTVILLTQRCTLKNWTGANGSKQD